MARMRAVCALLALESNPRPGVADIRRLIRTLGAACAPNASRANTARKEPSLAKILASAWSVEPRPAIETLLLMGVALGHAPEHHAEAADLHATLGMRLSVIEAAFASGTTETPAAQACAAHLSLTMDASPGDSSFYDIARAYGARHDLLPEYVSCLVGLGALVPTARAWLAQGQEATPSP